MADITFQSLKTYSAVQLHQTLNSPEASALAAKERALLHFFLTVRELTVREIVNDVRALQSASNAYLTETQLNSIPAYKRLTAELKTQIRQATVFLDDLERNSATAKAKKDFKRTVLRNSAILTAFSLATGGHTTFVTATASLGAAGLLVHDIFVSHKNVTQAFHDDIEKRTTAWDIRHNILKPAQNQQKYLADAVRPLRVPACACVPS